MNAATTTDSPLLFQWEAPAARRGAMMLFLIASFLAHAFCFYLFQIVYPPTIALLPPPARVSLISSDSEEGRTLLRWIEAEDPALAFTTLRSPENRLRALPKVAHVPLYTTNLELKQPPPLTVDLAPPSSQPPGRVPIVDRSATPAPAIIPTTVSFSEEFKFFGDPTLPPAKFVASTDEPAQSVRFRVGIDSGGAIRYCLPLNSSGDAGLDRQAHDFILLARFPQDPNTEARDHAALVWGMATINWGNDIALPPTPGQAGESATPHAP